MSNNNFFDLTTNNDLSSLMIVRIDTFNCQIQDKINNKIYSGFLLAKSDTNKVYTMCDFQKSGTDKKYQARLCFRKTDDNFKERNVRKGSDEVIISFEKGHDGYREFWKMISFLYKWRDTIDLGEFEDYFAITNKNLGEVLSKLSNVENKPLVLKNLNKLSIQNLSNISDLVSATKIRKIIEVWHLNKENYIEDYWQKLFQTHTWILSQIFSAPYIKIGEKFYCGGKDDDDKGGVKGDILYTSITNNIAFIEIKTPSPDLLIGNQYRGDEEGKENIIYTIKDELTGGINQVLNQRKTYLKQYAEKNGRKLDNAKCILIIGLLPKNEDQLKSFELFRGSLNNVEVITYDELFSRIEQILAIFE